MVLPGVFYVGRTDVNPSSGANAAVIIYLVVGRAVRPVGDIIIAVVVGTLAARTHVPIPNARRPVRARLVHIQPEIQLVTGAAAHIVKVDVGLAAAANQQGLRSRVGQPVDQLHPAAGRPAVRAVSYKDQPRRGPGRKGVRGVVQVRSRVAGVAIEVVRVDEIVVLSGEARAGPNGQQASQKPPLPRGSWPLGGHIGATRSEFWWDGIHIRFMGVQCVYRFSVFCMYRVTTRMDAL